MEHHKHAKAYSNILKLLPKASVNFQNPPYSPNRDKRSDLHRHHHHHHHHHKTHTGGGFSGPIMSMSLVPIEARRNLKNNNCNDDQSLANQEPTSPKISCMGQIKHKHKKQLDKVKSFLVPDEEDNNSKVVSPNNNNEAAKKRASMLKRMFKMSKPAAASRKSFDQARDHDERRPLPDRAPGLSQMMRFASSRETLASFDWTAAHQDAPETDRGTYYSYEVIRGDTGQEQEEDEFTFPLSTPISVVNGVDLRPRKEVNLWKRRTMNPPAPLQLNSMAG